MNYDVLAIYVILALRKALINRKQTGIKLDKIQERIYDFFDNDKFKTEAFNEKHLTRFKMHQKGGGSKKNKSKALKRHSKKRSHQAKKKHLSMQIWN